MSTFRQRYGNGPVSWPLSLRVAATAALAFLPVNMLLAVILEWGQPNAAFYLLVGGMTVVITRPVYVWLWTRTDESIVHDWHVERALRTELERDGKTDAAPSESLLDRERPPSRW